MRTRTNHPSTTKASSLAFLNKLAAITGVVTACAAALGGACSDPDPNTTGAGGKGSSSSSTSVGMGGVGGEDLNVVAGSVTIGSSSSSSGAPPPKCAMPDANGGKTKLASAFGDPGEQIGQAIAFDKSGNMLIAGSFSGSINFGGTTLTGTDDVFIAKFNPTGGLLWAKSFGDGNLQAPSGIGVDANGNVYLTGNFKGSINFGGGGLNAGGSLFIDMFLAKFTSDGTHVWSQAFGGVPVDSVQNVQGLAVGATGDVVITGFFQGGVNFGGAVVTSAGDYDVFVAKFNTGGTHQWSRRFGDAAGDQRARAVTLDPAGNVYLAGELTGSIDFGGGAMTAVSVPTAYVTKLDSLGNATWVKLSEGKAADSAYANSIAVGPNGEVAVGGYFNGSFAFGGTSVTGTDDAYVTLLSAAGAHTYTKTFGDGEAQSANGVAIASNGEVFVTGNFAGSIDLETGMPSKSEGQFDGYLARLNAKGCPAWLRTFAGPMSHSTKAIAIDPTTGGVALTGSFSGSADFGTGVITAAGNDVFLLSVNP